MSVAVLDSKESRGASASGQESRSHDPKVFVLNRELSEVHLLIDNLSANPDKSFNLLAVDDGGELPKTWLDEICRISWPPPDSTPEGHAQAALLIRAKDRLNVLAKPASGATIAFTLLVSQEEAETAKRVRGVPAPTLRSLASDAYPGLVAKAQTFRAFMRAMGWILLAVLIMTCALSWYVAYGASTVAQATTVQAALAAAEKRISDAEAPGVDKTAADTSTLAGKAVVAYCDRPKLLPNWNGPSDVARYESVSQMQACLSRDHIERQVRSVNFLLRRWMDPKSLFVPRKSDARPWRQPIDSGALQETMVYAQSILHILASSVLPVFYGVLGAAAAVLRSLSRKIKFSTLSPRDLPLSWQQLALGAVMGACIGLFVAQPTDGHDASPGLLGTVALSSSALSFVAGFGVDQVFTALEALMGRIFAVVQPAPAPGPTHGRTAG
jgi:hypothetical protein